MANATAKVNKGTVRRTDEFFKHGLKTLSAETTFYAGAMVGVNADGYFCKGGDDESWSFAGLVRGREGNPVMPVATQGDAGHDLDVHQPLRFELQITSVAVADIGKPVYADDDQTGILTPGSTTYANLIGHVVERVAANIALVEAAYDGIAANARLGATRVMAATGAQSLTRWDLNKVIILPNTAAFTLTLPAIAGCPAGSWLQFVKTTTDAAAVTLDGSGAETIDGAATLATIDAQYDCARLVSTGTEWVVTARDIA